MDLFRPALALAPFVRNPSVRPQPSTFLYTAQKLHRGLQKESLSLELSLARGEILAGSICCTTREPVRNGVHLHRQVTNPSFKQRCLYRVTLPLAQGITSNWPANPHPWRRHQGIQKHHFTRRNKYGFDKCLLLFAPVISNYPDIEDICITIGRMTALPFTKLKRSALELNRPAAAIDMNDKDIGDAIRLG